MTKINTSDLAGFFTWIVEAQEFLPLSAEAKEVVDQLIAWQSRQKEISTPTIAYLMPATIRRDSGQVSTKIARIDAAFAKLDQIERLHKQHFGGQQEEK